MNKLPVMVLAALLAACGNETKTPAPVTESAEALATEKAAKAIEKEAMIAKEAAEKATMAKEAAMKAAEKEAMIAKEQAAKAAMVAEEAAQQEAARTEAAKQEAARLQAEQEAARTEAARQETARLAAEQEAVRAEAARQETARLQAEQEAARLASEQAAAAANAYKVLSSGSWSKKTYSADGNWTLFSENGVTTVSLDSRFSTRNAPDLKIFLSPLSPGELSGRNATQGSLLISPLKSNSGAQSYTVPAGTDLSRYKTILIHCEAFSKLWSVSGI